MWDDKQGFQELQDICVDYIELMRKIKLYVRDNTVPRDSAPGVRSHSCWMEGLLTLLLLVLGLILTLGQNLRLSVVPMMNVFFLIFLRQMPKVIRRRLDPRRVPLPQYDPHRKECSVHGRKKILNCAGNSELFYEKPRVEAFNNPFEELDQEDDLWNVGTRPTYLPEAFDADLFRDIQQRIGPAKVEEIARGFSTVIHGDQLDTELCSKKREGIFEEQKDTTLSSKLVKNPPVRGQFPEAFIQLREG